MLIDVQIFISTVTTSVEFERIRCYQSIDLIVLLLLSTMAVKIGCFITE